MADKPLRAPLNIDSIFHLGENDGWEFLAYDIGNGGPGFLIGDARQDPNKHRLEILYWRPDGDPDGTQFVLEAETGNIGIGANIPTDKLTLRGGALAFQQAGQDQSEMGIDYDAASQSLRIRARKDTTTGLSDVALTITKGGEVAASAIRANSLQARGANDSLTIASAGTGALLLNPQGGNVGIGVMPTSARLEVNGTVKASALNVGGPVSVEGGLTASGSLAAPSLMAGVEVASPKFIARAAAPPDAGSVEGLYSLEISARANADYLRELFNVATMASHAAFMACFVAIEMDLSNLVRKKGVASKELFLQMIERAVPSKRIPGVVDDRGPLLAVKERRPFYSSKMDSGEELFEPLNRVVGSWGVGPITADVKQLNEWIATGSNSKLSEADRLAQPPQVAEIVEPLLSLSSELYNQSTRTLDVASRLAMQMAQKAMDAVAKARETVPFALPDEADKMNRWITLAIRIAHSARLRINQTMPKITTSGTGHLALNPDGGAVAIGRTQPRAMLDISTPEAMTGSLLRFSPKYGDGLNYYLDVRADAMSGAIYYAFDVMNNNSFSPNNLVLYSGAVGIGVPLPDVAGGVKLHVGGKLKAEQTILPAGDVAENYLSDSDLAAGDVVCLKRDREGIVQSTAPNDELALGVVSTEPGVMLNSELMPQSQDGMLAYPVALCGRVPCKVTDENGAIRIGDLLTTSSTPGHAMKATAVEIAGVKMHRPGTIIGKALEPLPKGRGIIEIFVTLK